MTKRWWRGALDRLARWVEAGRLPPHQPCRRARPRLERLEARLVPAVQPLTLADPTLAGLSGYGVSSRPSISSDGQFVLFQSSADNLVPNDTNGSIDVFLFNRSTGAVSLVSVGQDGRAAGSCGLFSAPVLSPDGRFAAFESSADGLLPGVTGDQV